MTQNHVVLLNYIPLQRPKYYKGYSSETFDLAVNSVVEGSLSIRRAAEEYAVPKSTLGDHVPGRVLAGAVGGRQRYLSAGEEKMLAKECRNRISTWSKRDNFYGPKCL